MICTPIAGWFRMQNPIKTDDLGVSLFKEAFIYPMNINGWNIGYPHEQVHCCRHLLDIIAPTFH